MAKKKKKDEAADKLKKHLQEGGYELANPETFFSGVDSLYRKPTVEQVIEEELPIIQGIDPDIFLRERIYINNVSQRLSKLYSQDELESAYWSFKVSFRHVRFFLRDAPQEEKELKKSLENLRVLFAGRYINEDLMVEYILRRQKVPYEDYQNMKERFREMARDNKN